MYNIVSLHHASGILGGEWPARLERFLFRSAHKVRFGAQCFLALLPVTLAAPLAPTSEHILAPRRPIAPIDDPFYSGDDILRAARVRPGAALRTR